MKSKISEVLAMLTVLVFSLIFVSLAFGAEVVAPPASEKPARMLVEADMREPPVTAVAVVQCNKLLVAYFTLKNGDLARIDLNNKDIDYVKALSWGMTATGGVEAANVLCVLSPGQILGT